MHILPSLFILWPPAKTVNITIVYSRIVNFQNLIGRAKYSPQIKNPSPRFK